jgi:hypothetical protein
MECLIDLEAPIDTRAAWTLGEPETRDSVKFWMEYHAGGQTALNVANMSGILHWLNSCSVEELI